MKRLFLFEKFCIIKKRIEKGRKVVIKLKRGEYYDNKKVF